MMPARYNIDKFETRAAAVLGYEPIDLKILVVPGLGDVIRCAIAPEKLTVLFPISGVAWDNFSFPSRGLNEFFTLADWFALSQQTAEEETDNA